MGEPHKRGNLNLSQMIPSGAVGLCPSAPAAGQGLLALLFQECLSTTDCGHESCFWCIQETPMEEHLLPLYSCLLLTSSC